MSKVSRSIAAVWKGLLDLLQTVGDRPLLLFVIVVFGGTAIWGQEYVGQLLDMLGDLLERFKP